MSEYKQCPNGHYYQGDHCPYCKGGSSAMGTQKTEIYGMGGTDSCSNSNETMVAGAPPAPARPTPASNPYVGTNSFGGQKTVIGGDATIVGSGTPGYAPQPDGRTIVDGISQQQQTGGGASMSGRTVFGDFDETGATSAPGGKPAFREARKFVGWLVSYTLDPLGVDFKIYEGRNFIGRDMDCNITINDNMVSAKHALLLYRAGKFTLTDQQSTHGTFVNKEDIGLEVFYLGDGDEIKIGQTVLKFRSAL